MLWQCNPTPGGLGYLLDVPNFALQLADVLLMVRTALSPRLQIDLKDRNVSANPVAPTPTPLMHSARSHFTILFPHFVGSQQLPFLFQRSLSPSRSENNGYPSASNTTFSSPIFLLLNTALGTHLDDLLIAVVGLDALGCQRVAIARSVGHHGEGFSHWLRDTKSRALGPAWLEQLAWH